MAIQRLPMTRLPERAAGPRRHLPQPGLFGAACSHPPVHPVQLSKPSLPILKQSGNVTHVITFGGFHNPQIQTPPAIQMKVKGVMRNQISRDPNYTSANDNINRLADSDWKDGRALTFSIKKSKYGKVPMILLRDPQYGELGRVPDAIAEHIQTYLEQEPNHFRFELSNMIAGTTRGAETIGLRVNLVYTGNNPKAQKKVLTAFNLVLNDPECRDVAMLYQPATSPEEVLRLILKHERDTKGSVAANKMELIINTIAAKINDPTNKRILLLGHCKPDGDTLGCVAGLKAAIELMDPDRVVDVAVDDKIPGLFRDKVPGIDAIKRPANPAKIVELEAQLRDLQSKPKNEKLKDRIESIQRELAELRDPSKLLDPQAKYDLVVTMDIPTPTRFTDKFKPYLDSAKDVIYMDHHPHRYNEWDAAAATTGLNIAEIHRKNLAWVADSVGACAQMIGVMADKLVPGLSQLGPNMPISKVFPTRDQQQRLAKLVANIVTGMSTDTGSFTRTANLAPEDMLKPAEQRPNFQPEGLAKWLMKRTYNLPNGRVDKKWLRENVTYGISDKAHDTMVEHAISGRKVYPEIGLGLVQVTYDQMNDVWQEALETDGAVTLLDIQNEFKYGEVLGTLKSDPRRNPQRNQKDTTSLKARAKQNYQGPYDQQRIAVLICQDKKAGELDEKIQVATQNGLRLSLRSADGTIHAELLAGLFGGGGHGGAAGGRVDLPGVDLNSPLAVSINGRLETDPAKILYALKQNHATMNNPRLSEADKKARTIPVSLSIDPANGKPCAELLRSVVAEIRAED